jgi:uroporphyrinogen-III synthase
MKAKTIVITRALGDDGELRHELQEHGYHVIHEPITEIFLRHYARIDIEKALQDEPDAVLITSVHGARSMAMLTELRDVFLLCVGQKTADVATELGFHRVCMAGENVERMIEYISGAYDDDARFLYISGEHISVDLGAALASLGMEVSRVVAYEAIAMDTISDTLTEQLKRGQIDSITFFSARTAEIFLALADAQNLLPYLEKIDAFCLSERVSAIASGAKWKTICSARQPTLASLINSVDNAYTNKG